MSTGNVMGIVPKLLPVTATFAAPLIAVNAYLQYACVAARLQTSTGLGNQASVSDASQADPVLIATSAHKNFGENVPLALSLAAMIELNGGSRRTLTYTMALFTLARISHVVGLSGGAQTVRFRQLGFFASAGSLLFLGGYGLDLVKSYWGF